MPKHKITEINTPNQNQLSNGFPPENLKLVALNSPISHEKLPDSLAKKIQPPYKRSAYSKTKRKPSDQIAYQTKDGATHYRTSEGLAFAGLPNISLFQIAKAYDRENAKRYRETRKQKIENTFLQWSPPKDADIVALTPITIDPKNNPTAIKEIAEREEYCALRKKAVKIFKKEYRNIPPKSNPNNEKEHKKMLNFYKQHQFASLPGISILELFQAQNRISMRNDIVKIKPLASPSGTHSSSPSEELLLNSKTNSIEISEQKLQDFRHKAYELIHPQLSQLSENPERHMQIDDLERRYVKYTFKGLANNRSLWALYNDYQNHQKNQKQTTEKPSSAPQTRQESSCPNATQSSQKVTQNSSVPPQNPEQETGGSLTPILREEGISTGALSDLFVPLDPWEGILELDPIAPEKATIDPEKVPSIEELPDLYEDNCDHMPSQEQNASAQIVQADTTKSPSIKRKAPECTSFMGLFKKPKIAIAKHTNGITAIPKNKIDRSDIKPQEPARKKRKQSPRIR